MDEQIREIIIQHAKLPPGSEQITEDTDLYRAGMKSFASVQLMLALEEAFDIEFPEHLLTRTTFRSLASIKRAIASITP